MLCQHLATPLKDFVEGDEGGLGGHYPLGHLRRGVIIPWVNLSVAGNGGTLPKVIPEGGAPPPQPHPPIMTELIRFLMVRSCVMTRTMHAWREANAYVRSGQHDRAIYWLSRTQAILDAGPPCRSRLKDVDAGYMLAALFFFVLIWVAFVLIWVATG